MTDSTPDTAGSAGQDRITTTAAEAARRRSDDLLRGRSPRTVATDETPGVVATPHSLPGDGQGVAAPTPPPPPVATAAPRVWVENGDRWHYMCSLCGHIFGPFARESNAAEFADLHASECSHA